MAISDHMNALEPAASADAAAELGTLAPTGLPQPTAAAPVAPHRSEFVYFALRNWKFVLGLGIVLFSLAVALVGPLLTEYRLSTSAAPPTARPTPSTGSGPRPSDRTSTRSSSTASAPRSSSARSEAGSRG